MWHAGQVTQQGVQVQLQHGPAPWLAYKGKWGSTVDAPALQEWFAKAENPVSRSWLAQAKLHHITLQPSLALKPSVALWYSIHWYISLFAQSDMKKLLLDFTMVHQSMHLPTPDCGFA